MKHATDGRHDFDFLFTGPGTRWRVRNQRRIAPCTDWQEFEALQEVRPVLGGLGNVDRLAATLPSGKPIEGLTLRIFNPRTRLWSLYWVDDRGCELQPPLVGRFEHGRGTFHGDDDLDGQPIRVVFHCTDITPTSARWEQAFSTDGGRTWETHWRMHMTREG